MANNNDGNLIVGLDIPKSVNQINADIKKLEKQLAQVKATGALDTSATVKQINAQIAKLQAQLKTIDIKANVDTKNVQKTGEQIGNNIAQGVSKGVDKATKQLNEIQHSLDVGDYDTQLKSYSIVLQKTGIEGDELKTKLKGASDALKELKTSTSSDDIIPSDVITRADTLTNEFEKLANVVKNIKLDNSLVADDIKVNDTITRLTEQIRKNGAYASSAKDKIHEWIGELEKGDVAEARLRAINSEAKQLHAQMAQFGKIGKSRWQTFAEGMKSFVEWSSASGTTMEIVQATKKMITNVKELDDALLELDKVSDLSADGLAKITEEAYKLGDAVGKTGKQVINAVTEFKRAGYDMQDSLDMSEAALVMTNVAEGITETSDAAGTLISVLKGFNMAESEAMSIVDMINSTSNQSPIGFDQLAEGLERTAGTLAQSGNSIQQTIGLLTAGYAQLRNVEKVSQGLITISARIRGVGEDGETIDGLSSKMTEDFGKLGIAVENADGSLRSIYQIAQDYSKVLPTLTDKQKQYYAELAAGKHQVTVWNAIVQQFKDAENATAQAIDSVGSASVENQKYLESISGKIEIFLSAVEKISSTLVESNAIKFFVDLGTTGVKAIDGLINSIGTLGTIGLIGGGILGGKNIGRSKMFGLVLKYADNNMCSLGY